MRTSSQFVTVLMTVIVAVVLTAPVTAQSNRGSVRKSADYRFNGPVQAIDISPDGKLGAVALIGSLNRAEVTLFDPGIGTTLHTFTFDESDIARKGHEPIRVRFTADSKQLAISFRSRIYFYDLEKYNEIRQIGVEGEDEQHLPAPMKSIRPPLSTGRIPTPPEEIADEQRWRREYIPEVKRIAKQGDGRLRITDFHFSTDGTSLLASYCFGECWMTQSTDRQVHWYSAGDDPVRLWDLNSNKVVWQRYFDPNEVVEQVVPSLDGKYFITVSNNTLFAPVIMRNIVNGDEMYPFPAFQSPLPPPAVSFLPDGRTLINRYDERKNYDELYGWEIDHILGFFDVTTGVLVAELHDKDQILDDTLSHDGRILLTYSWKKGKLKFWDMQTHRVMFETKPSGNLWKNRRVDFLRFIALDRCIIINSELGVAQVFELNIHE